MRDNNSKPSRKDDSRGSPNSFRTEDLTNSIRDSRFSILLILRLSKESESSFCLMVFIRDSSNFLSSSNCFSLPFNVAENAWRVPTNSANSFNLVALEVMPNPTVALRNSDSADSKSFNLSIA